MRRPAPAAAILALQRSAGNRAALRLLQRVVTIDNLEDDDMEPIVVADDQVKALVGKAVPVAYLPFLDEVVAAMTAPDAKHHYRTEAKLRNSVLEALQPRYVAMLAAAVPRLAQLAGDAGAAALAWSIRLLDLDILGIERLIAAVEPMVVANDLKGQFTDVFGEFAGVGTVFTSTTATENWRKGKQIQIDGLLGELRTVERIDPASLAANSQIQMGYKLETLKPQPSAQATTTSKKGGSRRPPEKISVKADLRYTDSAGVTWLVEIATGVEGLRKKVTREVAQRMAYETLRSTAQTPTNLKYVCTDPDGWMKLANKDGDPVKTFKEATGIEPKAEGVALV